MYLLRSRAVHASVVATALWSPGAFAQDTASASANKEGPSTPDEDPHELEGIVIEGEAEAGPPQQTTATTKLSREELEKHEEDDVHQVLLRVPGVQVRGEDGVGLRPNIGIRGTSPTRSTKIALMEDGILFGPAPYSAPAAYYFPLITRMVEVDVYKGGSSLRYGPRALGGALDLKTAPIEDGGSAYADMAAGQYGYRKLHARGGFGSERTGFVLEGVHLGSDGFKELDGGGNTGFQKNEFMAKWRINSAPDADIYHQLDLKFGFATESSNETYLGLTDDDFRDDPMRRYVSSELDEMNWHRGQFEARHTMLLSDHMELQTSLYNHRFTRDWFKVDDLSSPSVSIDEVLSNPDSLTNRVYYDVLTGRSNSSPNEELYLTDNYRWYDSRGIQSILHFDGRTGVVEHEIETGVRLHYDEVNRIHTRHTYQMTGATEDQLGHLEPTDDPTERITDNRGRTHALSVHVVDDISYEKWSFSPGIRLEAVFTQYEDREAPETENKRAQLGVLPGIGVHYRLSDSWGTFGGIYRGYGPVAPQAESADDDRPRAESSTTYELGLRYGQKRRSIESVAFYNRYHNLTANCSQAADCPAEDTGKQFDGGRADVFGLELIAWSEPRVQKLFFPLRATTTLSWGKFRNEFTSDNPEWGSVDPGDELPYLPRFSGTASAGIRDAKHFSVDASLTVASASREVAGSGSIPEESRTDPYALLGLFGRLRLIGNLDLYAKGTNLLNQAYLTSRRPHGARPGAPLWIQAGLKFEH